MHVAGVFASGLLVGGETCAYKQAPSEMVRLATQWKRLADEYGLTPLELALADAAAEWSTSPVTLAAALDVAPTLCYRSAAFAFSVVALGTVGVHAFEWFTSSCRSS